MNLLWGSALIASSAAALSAQDLTTLLSNTQQLQVTMTLDRVVYFPDEAASITILIKNPTASCLPVIAPFSTGGECFELYTPNPDGSFNPVAADVCDGATEATQTTPTTVFAAGEQRQIG